MITEAVVAHWFYKTNFCFNSFPFNDVLNFLFSFTGTFISAPGNKYIQLFRLFL